MDSFVTQIRKTKEMNWIEQWKPGSLYSLIGKSEDAVRNSSNERHSN